MLCNYVYDSARSAFAKCQEFKVERACSLFSLPPVGCGQCRGGRRSHMEINVIKVFVIALSVCVCALMPVKSDVYAFMT